MRGDVTDICVEKRYVGKEGRVVWVSVSTSVIRDESGRPLRTLAIIQDVTAHMEAEQALRTSEARYRGTLDGMMEGCQIISRDWRYLYINEVAARHGRRQAAELLGRTLMECYPGIESTPMFAAMRHCLETQQMQRMENVFVYPDGSSAEFELCMQPVDEGIFMLSLDITERKQAEEKNRQLNAEVEQRVVERTAQLEAVNKELEAFSYSVSHDLRAPLRAMDGFSRALQEEYGAQVPEDGRRYLQIIRTSAQRMGSLIDDLLSFSQLGRATLSKRTIDTTKLVQAALDELSSLREGRQIDLRIGDLPPCEGDPALLEQVWINLLSNAFKYSQKREAVMIEVGCKQEGKENIYFVRDNGTGFDMRYAHKLFGVFQRLHRAEDYDGTGVGLAIVQRIIHRHGGKVWAEAVVDQGATFYFTLEGEVPS